MNNKSITITLFAIIAAATNAYTFYKLDKTKYNLKLHKEAIVSLERSIDKYRKEKNEDKLDINAIYMYDDYVLDQVDLKCPKLSRTLLGIDDFMIKNGYTYDRSQGWVKK